MAYIKESLKVAFSTKQMYDLVNNIEAYPEFIAACTKASVCCREENSLVAELVLVKAGFTYKLKTCNKLYPYERIGLELLSGPFSSLSGAWSFIQQDAYTSIVELVLHFEIKNKLLNLAFNTVFQQISKELVRSFYYRAQQLYVLELTR